MSTPEYRQLCGLYVTYSWIARAGRHSPAASAERKLAIAADEAEIAPRYRQVFPHENREIFEVSEILRSRIAALEAEGFRVEDGVD